MNTQNYAPGMRVVIRDAEWRIQRVDNSHDNGCLLICDGISELVKGKEGAFLTKLEQNIEILDPVNTKLVEDVSSNYQASLLYMESQLRQWVPTDQSIHFGHRAAMDSMPFQLDPTILALRQPRQRILIADTVGLGKTLEAGILVSELIRRGRGKRILVLAVKSMLTQFQKEFWSRFAIPLTRLDSEGLQRVRNRIPTNHNPFHYFDKSIISIDTLKQDIEYRHHLENAWWDIIVIDEAHNVAERGSSSQRSKLAKLLAKRSDTLIMLSATPHDGKPESFASLMNMLDPTAIANPKEYKYEDFKDKDLVVRRFKKDVKDQMAGEFPERHIEKIFSQATGLEEEVYFHLAESQFLDTDQTDQSAQNKSRLFKITLEKALFSSPMACASVVANRLARLEKQNHGQYDKQIQELRSLLRVLNQVDAAHFSKYQQLLATIKDDLSWKANDTKDRLVIFTESIKTLDFLQENLLRDLKLKSEQLAILRGDQGDLVLMQTVEDFGKEKSPLRLLICSDVASEGINLHHLSHKMIHFDIPWSLMVFQQRNGRIDRYGQQHRPEIRYLLTESQNHIIKGDTRILEVLIEKDGQAQKNIGDSSEFTGKFTQEEEIEQVAEQMMREDGLGEDFLDDLLNVNASSQNANVLNQANSTVSTDINHCTIQDISLFDNEQKYCEKALGHLKESGQKIQYAMGINNTLSLVMPEDLRLRFKQLPPELTPSDLPLFLSQDKKVITDAIKRSHGGQHAWPDTSYLWQINPVVQWLDDKMQTAFGRHQAPIIRVPAVFGPDEDYFVLSGLFPNRKSHPVVNPWLVIQCQQEEVIGSQSFTDFLTIHPALKQSIPNTGKNTRDHQRQQDLLPAVIKRAKTEFVQIRNVQQASIDQQLQYQIEKLDVLRQRQAQQLALEFSDDKMSAPFMASRKEQKEREIAHNFDSYLQWIKDTMTTETQPYIQVIAVITGAES